MNLVFDAKNVYPSPTLPNGKIVVGKLINVEFDMRGAPYGFPYELEFFLYSQNQVGIISQRVLFTPGKVIKMEVAPFKWFKAGDKVNVSGRLYYPDPEGPYPAVVETPPSVAYNVVA